MSVKVEACALLSKVIKVYEEAKTILVITSKKNDENGNSSKQGSIMGKINKLPSVSSMWRRKKETTNST